MLILYDSVNGEGQAHHESLLYPLCQQYPFVNALNNIYFLKYAKAPQPMENQWLIIPLK